MVPTRIRAWPTCGLILAREHSRERKTGAPIVPGKRDASLVIQRITQTDKARRMPPEFSHKTLTTRADRHAEPLD